jgi:hypothetical protein
MSAVTQEDTQIDDGVDSCYQILCLSDKCGSVFFKIRDTQH